MKFHIRTLGCKMNQLDSGRLRAALISAGHEPVTDESSADYTLVNSCTVTAQADRKSRQAANAASSRSQQVAVLGCSVRVSADRWREALPDTLLFESDEELLDFFDASNDPVVLPVTSRTRMPVAIQTGCDDTCSFCITTVARGAHRSLPTEQITEQVAEAVRKGVREVVLTGINLAAWGTPDSKHQPHQAQLHQLLSALLINTDIERIRLSSLGPQYLQPPFWEVYSDRRICDYLHLSIQSGSVGVLNRMDRGHGTREVTNIADEARRLRPDTALAADFITGFPGETDEEHQQTRELISALGFSKLHVFPYSERQGTAAVDFPDPVPVAVRKARAKELRLLNLQQRRRFIESQLGKRLQVLVETGGVGWSSNYIRVHTGTHAEGDIQEIVLSEDTLAESGH